MKTQCYYQYPQGHFCKKWAQNGSRFCHNHQPPTPADDSSGRSLHPYARLSTRRDLFQFVGESLNALRMGAITPGQAIGTAQLVNCWLKLESSLDFHDRRDALRHQILPTLVDAEAAATAEREAATDASAQAAAPAGSSTGTSTGEKGNEVPPALAGEPFPVHDPWAAGRMAGPAPPEAAEPDAAVDTEAVLKALFTAEASAGAQPKIETRNSKSETRRPPNGNPDTS